MAYFAKYSSPIGELTLVSDGHALTGLWLDTEHFPTEGMSETPLPLFTDAAKWLDAYFHGKPKAVDFPVFPAGTDFRRRVWDILLTIPYGETRSYGDIAKQLSPSMSAQAVGGAVGANPVSIIIPCHRVVGAKGQLTGYAGGLDKKKWLLAHEEETK